MSMSVTKRQVPNFYVFPGVLVPATDEHRVSHYPDVLLIAVFAPCFKLGGG